MGMPSSKTPLGSVTPSWLQKARDHWQWRGQARPPFAEVPGPGQVSVWEFPRPPRVQLDTRQDVDRSFFERAQGGSFCEWKGPATYWTLVNGKDQLAGQAWSYPQPMAGAEALADCVAFYPALLDCQVDGARVLPQPGGFYGGWITPELVGPFKGGPGSTGW